jgi:hypothetical protein
MAHHAEFAGVIAIRQDLLQNLIRVLYHANQIPHDIGWGALGLKAALFLDTPEIVCSEASGDVNQSSINSRLTINLRAWGPILLQEAEQASILFTATIYVEPEISFENGALVLQLRDATLTRFCLEVLSGEPLSPTVQRFLYPDPTDDASQDDYSSTVLHYLIEGNIRDALSKVPNLFPGFRPAFLGGLITNSHIRMLVRSLAGVLAIGVDINYEGVVTLGDPNMLSDVTAGNDIGIWLNAGALRAACPEIWDRAEAAVRAENASLDNFSFRVEEGRFRATGKASKNGFGAVTFSMNILPQMIRPGIHEEYDDEEQHFEINTPAREELWFQPRDISVDIQPSWWLRVGEVLFGAITMGFLAGMMESYLEMFRYKITGTIGASSGQNFGERTKEFTLPNIAEPTVQFHLGQFECHTEGVFGGLTLRPLFPSAKLVGERSIAAEALLRYALPSYRVVLPFDTQREDPKLRVAWTVRRIDSNEILLIQDLPTGSGGLQITLEKIKAGLLSAAEFRIECRVYRPLGKNSTDLFQDWITVKIEDRLDRSHPYVRWEHDVVTPVVRKEPDGTETVLGVEKKHRVSDIHRTRIPGRCLMVTRFSNKVSRVKTTGSKQPHLEYLDSLPFLESELTAHRAQVCDYCFFGGPTKTVPLSLP